MPPSEAKAPEKPPATAKSPQPVPAKPKPDSIAPAKVSAPPKRRRKPIPAALKAIAGLVVVAVAFLVAAIVGGSGSKDETPTAAAPPPVAGSGEPEKTAAAQTAEQLGYPSFATNNTTRIGGSDPAANAAAVALAVYPSSVAGQRPAAVTLVDEESWQGAIAASVLMAAPIRAPVLISSASGPPDATAQALEALDPRGSKETGGAQAFAVGAVEAPEGLKTRRVAGKDPAAIAAGIAALRDELSGGPPAHLVVAPVDDPAFAMPAAAWAARSGDPVLFAGATRLPQATAAALKRHAQTPVYVLGPSAAISSDVVRKIAKIGGPVRRVSGEDPVANAIALARYADGDFGWNVNDPGHGFVVARGDSPLDAAAAAPLSGSGTWGPLLLTDSAGTLPVALREYLLDIKPGYTTDPTRAFYNHVWVIGDGEAIGVNQQAEIDGLAEVAKTRGEP